MIIINELIVVFIGIGRERRGVSSWRVKGLISGRGWGIRFVSV